MEEGKFCIRFMKNEDIPAMKELHEKVLSASYSDSVFDRFLQPEFLSLSLVRTDLEEEEIVGFSTSMRIWHSKLKRGRDGFITTFGIDERYQGHGLGSALLQVTLYILFDHFGVTHAMCDIMKDSVSAFNFCKKRGLYAQRILKNAIKVGEQRFDGVLVAITSDRFNRSYTINSNIEIDQDVQKMMKTKKHYGLLFPALFGRA